MNKKQLIISAALVFVFMLFRLRAGAVTYRKQMLVDALVNKYGPARASKLQIVYDSLKQAGLPDDKLRLTLSQVMQETGVFLAHGEAANNDNNFSGIMYINNPAVQKNASQGAPFPVSESRTGHYAHFNTPLDWANDYIRIINRAPNFPIQAVTPVDFANRLKRNNYFKGPLATYAKNLTYFYNYLASVGV